MKDKDASKPINSNFICNLALYSIADITDHLNALNLNLSVTMQIYSKFKVPHALGNNN